MTDKFADNKAQATAWFRALRDKICAEFEALEHEAPVNLKIGCAKSKMAAAGQAV